MADHSLTLNLVLPALEVEAELAYRGPMVTGSDNGFDGAECGGGAIVEYTPVMATGGSYPLPVVVDKALAFPMPDLNDKGWPVTDDPDAISFVNPKVLTASSHVDQIIVGGRDITWIFATDPGDQPTAMPGYTTIEPFGYGASQPLKIPRTNSLFEKYGQGRLRFLHEGAHVLYRRIYNPGTEDQVTVTDYRGVVEAVDTSQPEFQARIGGEVVSRAGAKYKPPPKYRKLYDLGSMMGFACRTFGIHLVPANGPDTGIPYPNQGGTYYDSWMTNLGAMSRTQDTQQRVLMPHGTWGGPQYDFEPKDTTTIHGTIHVDGDTVAAALVDDALEQPTGVYGNGTDPNGQRWDGAVYPGVVQGPPGAYPFDDNRTFTIGMTDAGTDSGFGITAMRHKLVWDGLLNDDASSGDTFDAEVGRAVKLLKIAANMTANAVMTPAAWKALWDTDAVGFSLEGARILPIAEASYVRSYNLTPGGTVISRNENHIVGAFSVDVALDYDVVSEDHARRNARSIIQAGYGHQWAGTVTLNQVHAFTGDVDDADIAGLTTADILRARDIRPGMNLKLPHFEGGTVVHVAQVTVTPGENGDTVQLMVDTGARDVFDLSQALKRNKESKRSPYRERLASSRGYKPPGNLTPRDRFFGKVYQDVRVAGGRWNQFPVIMGQQGTVGYTDVLLQNIATEYCLVLATNPISPAKMAKIIGNPFQLDENGQTAFEHQSADFMFDRKILLYLSGEGQQPDGFGWKKGYFVDEDGELKRFTANPLTGRHQDGSPFPYVTNPKYSPLAYALLFPRRSSTVRRGRLFYALEDDVT